MEKIILIMFHALFGGAVVMLGGLIGYVATAQLAGQHTFLPLVGFILAALASMVVYIRMNRLPKRRAVL